MRYLRCHIRAKNKDEDKIGALTGSSRGNYSIKTHFWVEGEMRSPFQIKLEGDSNNPFVNFYSVGICKKDISSIFQQLTI